jgi:hypothetical protein
VLGAERGDLQPQRRPAPPHAKVDHLLVSHGTSRGAEALSPGEHRPRSYLGLGEESQMGLPRGCYSVCRRNTGNILERWNTFDHPVARTRCSMKKRTTFAFQGYGTPGTPWFETAGGILPWLVLVVLSKIGARTSRGACLVAMRPSVSSPLKWFLLVGPGSPFGRGSCSPEAMREYPRSGAFLPDRCPMTRKRPGLPGLNPLFYGSAVGRVFPVRLPDLSRGT